MKKKSVGGQAQQSVAQHLAPVESDVFCRLQSLVSHMAVTKYDDGDPRRPGWITLSTLGSSWKIVAKDPDSGLQVQAIGSALDDTLALMELLLSAEETPWEPDPFAKKPKK